MKHTLISLFFLLMNYGTHGRPSELRKAWSHIWLRGHSNLKMLTKVYDHTSVETLRDAIEKADNGREPAALKESVPK